MMKSKKYIKDNLNQALDDIAPDILTNIIATDRVEVKSLENDLRDEPLFLDEMVGNRASFKIRMGALTTVVLLMVSLCVAFIPKLTTDSEKIYCTITVDVNPSINLHINKEGQVVKVDANNNDGTKIAEQIGEKITQQYFTEDAIRDVVSKLKDKGYLDKKNAAMLISSNKSFEGSSQGISKARNAINKYKSDNNDNFVAVYQEFKQNKTVEKIAEDNGISVAKAAYCLKISEKTEESYDTLCKESISNITKKVVAAHIDLGEEIVVVEQNEEFTEEAESIMETLMEEISNIEEESTVEDEETSSEILETESYLESTAVIEEPKTEEYEIHETPSVENIQEVTEITENETEKVTEKVTETLTQ